MPGLQHDPHESNTSFNNIMINISIKRYTNTEWARCEFIILPLSNLPTFKCQWLRPARIMFCVQIHCIEDIYKFSTTRFTIIIFGYDKPKITVQSNLTSYHIKDIKTNSFYFVLFWNIQNNCVYFPFIPKI